MSTDKLTHSFSGLAGGIPISSNVSAPDEFFLGPVDAVDADGADEGAATLGRESWD